jgi:isoleucyl-tRNA synthetase
MSKSLGNTIVPQEVSEKLGAEILRLWVASTDYSGELSISKQILDRVVETYRRIRNTLRFLLANTADFDIARDGLPVDQWLDIDRYALAFTRQMAEQAQADYGRFEFHRVVQGLQIFCSEELGAFYLDILKDRLYTTQPGSAARRAAQSAIWHITQTLLKLMAPVLSFTAEEAWAVLNGEDDSIMLHTWHALPAQDGEDALVARWNTIREARAEVQKVLEALRTEGAIGAGLQAEVTIKAAPAWHAALASLGDDLRFVLQTSAATLEPVADEASQAIEAIASTHAKCERCWHYREDVGHIESHPTLCGRCHDNLEGDGEVRTHA